MSLPFRLVCMLVALTSLRAPRVLAQRDTVVVAGPHYAKGGAYRFVFGTGYRALWTTPVAVPVLDLRTFAGGLTPLSAGGGFQTKSIWFRGADGYQYAFRGVDKVPVVLPELDSTFIQDIIQDAISAGHPGAPGVVAPLLAAAGVPHVDALLVMLPDDAALDTFRLRFAGTLGFLSRRTIVEPSGTAFLGAREIISSRNLLRRTRLGPDDRVDARALLAARLVDIWIGDWDRHRGQWTWARLADTVPRVWTPIPEDRDQAFVRFDGLALSLARATAAPQLVRFGDGYADIAGQTWNGRDLDRWLLGPLDRAAFDAVAASLQERLTDSVIADAVRRLPPEWYALDGARLATSLRRRRDALRSEAVRWYRLLAREAELHGTAAAEAVTVDRLEGGRVSVRIAPTGAGQAPWLARTFDPDDTHEVRLYLRGGADRVVVRGDGDADIAIRVIADDSATVLDSSAAGGVRRYAADWRPPEPPSAPGREPRSADAAADEPVPQRDWGTRTTPQTWVAYGPDIGVFLGAGFVRTGYGFRAFPYASRWRLRGGWASNASPGRVALDGTLRRTESAARLELGTYLSGIEVIRWNGAGNATVVDQPDDYYRVSQAELTGWARIVVPVARRLELGLGPRVSYGHTRTQAGRIIADSLPYGTGHFGRAGLVGSLDWATDCCWPRPAETGPAATPAEPASRAWATRGVRVALGGAVYPALWDVATTFGEVHGEVAAYVTGTRLPLHPTLALRAGGKRVFGTYPFTDAAFIGDVRTVRLGRKNRYAGDAAAWGNAEVRFPVTRFFVLLPGQLGLLALADAGRVFVTGETSERWHSAVGGGVWFSVVQPQNVFTISVASSAERTAVYVGAGFAY